MPDAISFGLVERINKATGSHFTREHFLADCRSRAREEGIFQQTYMCNPLGAAVNHIAEWSSIEQCRNDYRIERVHLEAAQIIQQFGGFNPSDQGARQSQIESFLRRAF